MSALNPISGLLLQSTQVQRQMSADKERQVRRAQALEKDIALRDDEMEHQVESSEDVRPVGDESDDQREQSRRKPDERHPPHSPEDEPPHIDLTA